MADDSRVESILSYLVWHPKVGTKDTNRAAKLLEEVIKGNPVDEATKKRLLESIKEKDEKTRLMRLNLATQPHDNTSTPEETGRRFKQRQQEDDTELHRRIKERDSRSRTPFLDWLEEA